MDKRNTFRQRAFNSLIKQPTFRTLPTSLKYSDENPLDRNLPHHKFILRKKKIWISSLQEQVTSQTPDNFSVEINDANLINIRYLKPIQVHVNYTVPATAVRNAFVLFPDLEHAEQTSNGHPYHGYFPVIQGTVAATVLFNYMFSTDYITDFKKHDVFKNKIRVQVFKENSSTGAIELFTELNQFAVEIELDFIDPVKSTELSID